MPGVLIIMSDPTPVGEFAKDIRSKTGYALAFVVYDPPIPIPEIRTVLGIMLKSWCSR